MPFRDIAGHRHVIHLVAGAATRGTLPPCLIFAGPEGVGKRLIALALAQLVNCPAPITAGTSQPNSTPDLFGPSTGTYMVSASELGSGRDMVSASELGSDALGNDACGVCASCSRIARNVHADVLILRPGDTGSIKIDLVREAIDRTTYRPFEGRRRVVIVDEADAMVGEAQNALLKTLEEPRPASMFVLVTSRPDMLLPTVRSRCQLLRFGRLSAADVASVLMRSHGYSSDDAHAVASVADGSLKQALEGASESFVAAREAAAQMLQGVGGSTDTRRRLGSAKAFAGGGDRDELGRRLRALASMLRDLAALGSRADEQYLANVDLAPVLRRLAGSFDGRRVTRAFAAVDRALAAIDRNASPKIVSDWLAFQL
jgi:DNA polymerase III subunit delta'